MQKFDSAGENVVQPAPDQFQEPETAGDKNRNKNSVVAEMQAERPAVSKSADKQHTHLAGFHLAGWQALGQR